MPNREELQAKNQPPTIFMWGFLPACDPDRSPLLSPVPAPPPLLEEGWKSLCSGGFGFAVGISEAGKVYTWGSTDNPGQSYVTSGKLEERPEPFPLPTDTPIIHAAAGWAHCAAVTEKGEVYTWGWKECVPTVKSSVDQSASATASAEKDAHESHSHGKDAGEDGVYTNVQLSSDHIDMSESGQMTAADTAVKNKGIMAVGVKVKVASPIDKSRGGLPSPSSKTQLGKMPRISSTGSLLGVEKAGDEVSKKRRLAVEHVTSPDSSTMGNDEHVSAPPCLVALHPGVQIASVAAGGRHILALSDTGQVWGWGYGGEGQLGLGSRIRSVSSPQLIPSIEASSMYWQDMHASTSKQKESSDGALLPKVPGNYVKAVACGGRHSAVVTDAGALLTFGWGLHGQVS